MSYIAIIPEPERDFSRGRRDCAGRPFVPASDVWRELTRARETGNYDALRPDSRRLCES